MFRPASSFLAILFIASSAVLAAPQTWELRDDQWQHVDDAPRARPQVQAELQPDLDRAEQLLDQRRHRRAREILLDWLDANPASPARDRALYLLAEMYFQHGDRIRAFYHLDEVMDLHPETPLFYPALQKQYEIADAYLRGYKRRLLLIPMLGAEDEAVEMLFRIQQRSPGSPIAERALLRTADYYYADGQFDLAADAYGAYVRSYPRSPMAPRAQLRQAFATLAQFRGPRFDPTPIMDARAQLADIAAAYPDLAREHNVPEIVRRIDLTFARKLYQTGDFYRRTGRPRSAVFYYRQLLETYPNSTEATWARQDMDLIPARARRDAPEPPFAEEYAPSDLPQMEAR